MIILQRNNIELLKHVDEYGLDVYTVRELNNGDCYVDQFADLDGAIDHIAGLPNGFDLRLERVKTNQPPSIYDVALIMGLGCLVGMLFINWLGLL